MKLLRSLLVSPLLFISMALHAQVDSGVPDVSPRWLSLPYLQWFYPSKPIVIESDLKFIADPGNGTAWFLAQDFAFSDSSGNFKGAGYIGLQTTAAGKGIIFSLWDTFSATPGPGAICRKFTGEGEGTQCLQSYPWVAGRTYRLKVVNNRNTSYSGYVIDMSTTPPTETLLGHIQAPPSTYGFSSYSGQWAEFYGGSVANCTDFPYVKALWTRPKGNNGALTPTGTSSYGADPYCKNSAVIPNGVDHYMEGGNPGVSTRQNLLSATGKYIKPVSVNGACGGSGLKADGSMIDYCTGLTRVALPNGKVALQAENGLYLSCAGGGGSTVAASARTITNNETFTEVNTGGSLSYKSYGGRYLTASSFGSLELRCSAYMIGSSEKFTPVLNKALTAKATVSSESVSTSQLGIRINDGGVTGYPGDVSREWVTNGEGVGAWAQLTWSAPVSLKQVFLYDRPNLNDQILAGTLLFSDGSSISVGALPNNGNPLRVSFSSKNVSWVKFRVDQKVGLIGLAEMEAY